MNKVFLIGRLTKEIELRKVGESSVAEFTIAVDNFYGKEKSADFITCVSWNKSAENLEKFTKKGSLIAVFGSLNNSSFKNKDGTMVYKTKVNVSEFKLLDSKGASSTGTSTKQTESIDDILESADNFDADMSDDLPF